MQVEVINVGDGACAAASCYCCSDELTLVDCGTHPRSKVSAGPGATAAQQLGGRLADLTTMVVTHFDIDHWGGLLELVQPYVRQQPDSRRQIRLFYPGMPVGWATSSGDTGDDLLMAMMAVAQLISTKNADPVSAIALRNAWRGNAVIKHSPLYRGQRFMANGCEWTVHWPPRRVSAKKGRVFEGWLERVRQVADEMAEDPDHPDPRLRDQLNEAYEVLTDLQSEEDALTEADLLEPIAAQLGKADWSAGDEDEVDEDPDADEFIGREDTQANYVALDHVPELHRAKVREIADGLVGIDNYLSLVVSVSDEFLCFGDIEGSALGDLLRTSKAQAPEFADQYDLILAPHHGSHDTHARKLPDALVCVSQNGSWLEGYNEKHVKRHKCLSRSTWHNGSMVFDLCCGWSPMWCRHRHRCW